MEQKNIVATIFLKDGQAVLGTKDFTEHEMDFISLAKHYSDSGIDKIMCIDLSDDDEEHEKNILAIRQINRSIDIKTCACGNIRRLEDVKKLLYAGCVEVILNGKRPETFELVKEASDRFGKKKILVYTDTLDFVFKTKDFLEDCIHELIISNETIIDSIEQVVHIPYILQQYDYDPDKLEQLLLREDIRGVYGVVFNDINTDIMAIKVEMSVRGIKMDNFEPKIAWSDLKPNADGLVPVIVQDYQTDEVLMLAYMNEEAFYTTMRIGKMTYWSRSRNELWTKGLTSGHIQYVKSLTADCDFDTILAKVSQVGGIACHTGKPSCFFNEIVSKEYVNRNPLKVFEDVYGVIIDRKENPRAGSYTNYLFDKGIDKILKKVGEEAAEIIIAAKNPESEEIIYEISDFLYHVMVLMAERNITWEEVTRELAHR